MSLERWNCSGREGEEEDGGRMRLLDVRMEVLGSPGLPGNSNPTHGTFQAELGSAVFRVSFPLGVSP